MTKNVKIKSIRPVGKQPVYDLTIENAEQYVLGNDVISHNTGAMYSSDTVWIVSRAQEKDGDELAGYKFTIKPEKSRYIKENARIPIMVDFESGVDQYSGLFDLAKELGYIVEASKGFYSKVDMETGTPDDAKLRAKALVNDADYWKRLVNNIKFRNAVAKHYMLAPEYEDEAGVTSNKAPAKKAGNKEKA